SNNRVFELMYDAGGDRWVADPNSVFAGLETDGLFETSRSRNSFPLEWEDPSVFYAEDEPFADSEERVWCLADLTATSDPGAEGYGLPEGIVNEADVEYFSQQYDRGNVLLCDVSGPTPGVPDGQLDGIDRAYYLELWDTGVVDCPETTSDVSPGLPNDLSPNGGLRQVQVGPSPFRSGTSVRFELAAVKNVALGVYDMNGRLVRNLAEGPFGQGVHVVDWDGRDTAGSDVPSGVYWIRVTLPGSEGWSERVLRVR
ncbi:MAG: T9SS type A sorting domain-containing protein, partial [Candidatus Eisenbacteria bacterium]|nr:T9SS type A sorting domain-containing protein [Candidatus Eisenbacteria bacterium]